MEITYPIYKTCCFTGHRPKGFPWDYEDKRCLAHRDYLQRVEYFVEQAILRHQTEYFICGSAMGADTDFAEAVIRLRKKYPHIKLEIAEPYTSYGESYAEPHKSRYRAIIQQADKIHNASQKFTPWCIGTRNRYMVDHSDMLIAVWNGNKEGGTYNTLTYAEKKNKKVRYIGLPPANASAFIKNFDFFLVYASPYETQKQMDENLKRDFT
ncbi:MAG: DUF1273 family protein [Clostridia bacterium]|nr:DUF1273 family protein [Clostridia bacterium]